MHTRSSMERLSSELISRIALSMVFADGSSSPGPPSTILPLSYTCRTLNRLLALNQNWALLAGIFHLKFDSSAATRRYPLNSLSVTHYAAELRRRFNALKRIKAGVIDEATLLDDLWVAYLLMLENDGLNAEQLIWADLTTFLYDFLRNYSSSTTVIKYPKTISLVVWLIWLTSTYDSLQLENASERKLVFSVLKPLVVAACRHSSVYLPETLFHAGPCASLPNAYMQGVDSELITHVEHYGHRIRYCTPPVTPAAFLAIAARLDFDRRMPSGYLACLLSLPPNREAADALRFSGPTLEDMLEARSTYVKPWSRPSSTINPTDRVGFVMASVQHDAAWRRLTLMSDLSEFPSSHRVPAFVPGQLTGLWTGKFLVADVSSYRAYLSDTTNMQVSDVPLYQRPLQMRLREYFCPLSGPHVMDGTSSDQSDIFKKWLPDRYTLAEEKDKSSLTIRDRVTQQTTIYPCYVPDPPGEDGVRDSKRPPMVATEICGGEVDDETEPNAGVSDVLLIGETDPHHGEAWGHFKFVGRVRLLDGLIMLRREPRDTEQIDLGTWLFIGYIQAPSVFVGRWRESSILSTSPVLDGPFVVSKH